MNIAEADAFARHLLPTLGLADWSVVWCHGARFHRIAGVMVPDKRIIEISKPIVLINDFETVSEIVRHEAAHAVVPFDAHGPVWKAVAERFGCRHVNDAGTIPMRLPQTLDVEDVAV